MEVSLRRTHELTPGEKERICLLFREVFGCEKPLEKFRAQFERNGFGYSYHGLLLDGGRMVGCYTSIPFHYHYFGKREIFAESVDTMIHPDYRGSAGNLKDMAESVYAALAADGIPFVFGAPNERIHSSRKRKLAWKDIAELDFHVLPVRIGALKKPLRFLDPASRAFAWLVNAGAHGGDATAWVPAPSSPIEKVNGEEFAAQRFGQYDQERYRVVPRSGGHFVYKVEVVDGIRTGNLLDVYPLCRENLEAAVGHIHRSEAGTEAGSDAIDAIVYVGTLPFRPRNLFRVPAGMRPRKVRVSGRILIEGRVDERIFDAGNWNLNLSNFDFA